MFLGEFQHTIDAKGRLAIPAKFRGELARGVVLVRGIEDCLYGFSEENWEAKALELAAGHLDPRRRRMIERRFFGMAEQCELDSQGRLVVPPEFRRYANLTGEVTVLGTRQRFEIWSRERWRAYQAEMDAEDLSDMELPF
jgi:MraZ protein